MRQPGRATTVAEFGDGDRGRCRLFMRAIPVLHVCSAAAAAEFYCRRLGFRRTSAYCFDEASPDPCYLGLARDGATLHVSTFAADGVPGGVIFLVVEDVDRLHADLVAGGVPIALEPTDQTWGNREMYVEDPDGNSLRFVHVGGGCLDDASPAGAKGMTGPRLTLR